MKPNVYIIAGPNGAGKTTFAREFLPHYANCTNFINADLIALGVAPLSPETAAMRAGRLMISEIAMHSKRRADFGFETTFSGNSHLKSINRLIGDGYRTHIFFLWLPKIELALDRVRLRVLGGGHDVPEAIVRRRYNRSIRNFLNTYRSLTESWILFDNSGETPKVIASGVGDKARIMIEDEYRNILQQYDGK
jgi:predicted ABC-type ATPase